MLPALLCHLQRTTQFFSATVGLPLVRHGLCAPHPWISRVRFVLFRAWNLFPVSGCSTLPFPFRRRRIHCVTFSVPLAVDRLCSPTSWSRSELPHRPALALPGAATPPLDLHAGSRFRCLVRPNWTVVEGRTRRRAMASGQQQDPPGLRPFLGPSRYS